MKRIFSYLAVIACTIFSVSIFAQANMQNPACPFNNNPAPFVFHNGDNNCPNAGAPGFCACEENNIIQGCMAKMHSKSFCTIGHLIVIIVTEGLDKACKNDSDPAACKVGLESYIYNKPANNPHCPMA